MYSGKILKRNLYLYIMKNMEIGLLALAVAGTAIPATAAQKSKGGEARKRPNILICVADDASWAHFSAAGCAWVDTPAFDRVASQGVYFENCYTPNAKSAPSRSIMLTGRNSWQLGEGANHYNYFPGEFTVFPEALLANGYRTGFTGKGWGPGDPGKIDGQERQLTGTPYQTKTLKPPTRNISNTDYCGNFVDFLNVADDRPWFFWCGSREPHRPYVFHSGVDVGGHSTGQINHVPGFLPDNEIVRNDLLDYAFEVEYFDKTVGLLLGELERRGELDNTVVIVTSDNGMPFPRAKTCQYEYSHHMPLAVMWSKGIKKPGRRVSDYVSFTDLAPTILDLAGVEWESSGMQPAAGCSLRPVLESKNAGRVVASRDHVLVGRERHDIGRPGNQGYPIRGIVKEGWLYLYNLKSHLWPVCGPESGYAETDGSPSKTQVLELYRNGVNSTYFELCMGFRPSEELYDLSNDADCVENLACRFEHQARRKEMRDQLIAELYTQGDPRMTGDGDQFDRYPYTDPQFWNFYERVESGELAEPWKVTLWLLPSNYDRYVKLLEEGKIEPFTKSWAKDIPDKYK